MQSDGVGEETIKGSRILVIDDSRIDRELSAMVFKKNGFEVIALDSGRECVAVIEAQKPDLVLLDIMMPGIGGNEVLGHIRARWSQIELPVIMVTAKIDASDVIESLKAGANDFVTKPVDFQVAVRRIETHLLTAKLSKNRANLMEIMAINAMVSTYSHEINNPLTIAIGKLNQIVKKQGNSAELGDALVALWRIADIVTKTQDVLKRGSVEYEKYSEAANFLKLKAQNE